jgi:heme-degrading monooxygenase HmoA
MAVQVIISRKVKQGQQAKILVPLILQMRAIAIHQPGFISSDTWSDVEDPGECMVISRWQTVEDWNRWAHSEKRLKIENKIEALSGHKSEYKIYASMVVRSNSDESGGS